MLCHALDNQSNNPLDYTNPLCNKGRGYVTKKVNEWALTSLPCQWVANRTVFPWRTLASSLR